MKHSKAFNSFCEVVKIHTQVKEMRGKKDADSASLSKLDEKFLQECKKLKGFLDGNKVDKR